ncbi:acetyl-CoA carboxylase [Halorientalis pallida]|uniref:Biotin carboxyl carrier protein of acetyl-CoA carboxylase n=1 Tax=Halorientalis pallida TaxID=2479928 RepID=A0A498KZE4_9EURY|nr:acetyl-CoA carboxylase [Halorientalis pallida]RXK47920.1 biotin carboxyl carrier domain-containing protein [Halorientalis pallida]
MADNVIIEAPMPGVFYRRPDPEEPVFAEEGDDVDAGDKVALIGVMKSFHDVTVDTDGVVTEFLVDNESEVEAGDALLTVAPS